MPVLTNAAEEVLVYLLRSAEAVRELIHDRIQPDQLPLEWRGKTSLIYEQQADTRTRLVGGAEGGLVRASFSIFCVDRNRGVSRILSKAVREAIATNGRQTIAGVDVRQVFVKDGERDESLPGVDGKDAPDRYRTLDCTISYHM